MFATAGKCRVPYILMHMKGTPKDMQEQPIYTDVTLEVMQYFTRKMSELRKAGVKDILLDPGFGSEQTNITTPYSRTSIFFTGWTHR